MAAFLPAVFPFSPSSSSRALAVNEQKKAELPKTQVLDSLGAPLVIGLSVALGERLGRRASRCKKGRLQAQRQDRDRRRQALDFLIPSQLWPALQSETFLAKDEKERREQGDSTAAEAARRAAGGYNFQEVQDEALKDPVGIVLRAAQVALTLGRFYLTLKIDEWQGHVGPRAVKTRSKELRTLLVQLGTCYIKVGQALANRPDIVRDDYMAELEELQDNVPPFPTGHAMKIIEQELGKDLREVFAELSPLPVAAASLGQVYRGRLRSSGADVAVKVQRPGLKETLCQDMFIFRQLARLVNSWSQEKLGCNITLIVDEFGCKLWEEANYIVEAANARSFTEHFWNDPTVKIPKVYLEHTTKRVITMEWINGVKCTDLAAMRRANIDVDVFMRNGVQAALRQLLEFGLFHGDPHAGNVFAMPDGRIAYIDFGNVASISGRQRDVLLRAITHVSNSDYEEIAQDFVRLGFLRPGTSVAEIVPAMGMIWKDSMGKSIRDFNFRTVTARFSKLVYQFPIRIPERFSLVIRALLMQEGICLCLNPNFSVIEVALPFASKRLLSDPDPSMRRELTNVVFGKLDNGRREIQWDRLKNLVRMAKQARDGTTINFNEVFVNFMRGLRRDLLSQQSSLPVSQVLRSSLQSLFSGEGKDMEEITRVLELVSPDLTPELLQQVADALLRDSVQDLLNSRGLKVEEADLADPRRLGKVLRQPDQLRKLLPLPQ